MSTPLRYENGKKYALMRATNGELVFVPEELAPAPKIVGSCVIKSVDIQKGIVTLSTYPESSNPPGACL